MASTGVVVMARVVSGIAIAAIVADVGAGAAFARVLPADLQRVAHVVIGAPLPADDEREASATRPAPSDAPGTVAPALSPTPRPHRTHRPVAPATHTDAAVQAPVATHTRTATESRAQFTPSAAPTRKRTESDHTSSERRHRSDAGDRSATSGEDTSDGQEHDGGDDQQWSDGGGDQQQSGADQAREAQVGDDQVGDD